MTILEFLREYQEELFSERIEYKEELDLINTRLMEDRKFVDVLLSTNDSYFSEFSPRNLNEKNNEKAAEIKESILKQEEYQASVEDKLNHIDYRLAQIKELIDNEISERKVKQSAVLINDESSLDNSDIEAASNISSSDSYETKNVFDDKPNIDVSSLLNKLTAIKSFIKVDNNRAIADLDLIIKSLK